MMTPIRVSLILPLARAAAAPADAPKRANAATLVSRPLAPAVETFALAVKRAIAPLSVMKVPPVPAVAPPAVAHQAAIAPAHAEARRAAVVGGQPADATPLVIAPPPVSHRPHAPAVEMPAHAVRREIVETPATQICRAVVAVVRAVVLLPDSAPHPAIQCNLVAAAKHPMGCALALTRTVAPTVAATLPPLAPASG